MNHLSRKESRVHYNIEAKAMPIGTAFFMFNNRLNSKEGR